MSNPPIPWKELIANFNGISDEHRAVTLVIAAILSIFAGYVALLASLILLPIPIVFFCLVVASSTHKYYSGLVFDAYADIPEFKKFYISSTQSLRSLITRRNSPKFKALPEHVRIDENMLWAIIWLRVTNIFWYAWILSALSMAYILWLGE